jgi:EF hand
MKYPAKTILLALTGVAVLATAVPSFAQDAEGTPPAPNADVAESGEGMGHGMGHGKRHGRHGEGRDGEHGGRGGGRMMRMIDANADGVIGADEAATMADRMFGRLDQNGDDILDKAEFATPPGRRGKGWFNWGSSEEAAAVLKVREDKFTALDADKDGKLTKVEFFAEAQQRLAAADADKDGKVTPWEFRAASPMK